MGTATSTCLVEMRTSQCKYRVRLENSLTCLPVLISPTPLLDVYTYVVLLFMLVMRSAMSPLQLNALEAAQKAFGGRFVTYWHPRFRICLQ